MKYLKVKGVGSLEAEGWYRRAARRAEEDWSSISDARCVLVFWSSSLRLDVMIDVLCCLRQKRHPLVVVVDDWWGFFFFRLGFLFQFLLYSMNRQTCILGFGFFFSWEFMDLLPFIICWVYFSLFFFFRLDLLYHLLFRIDVGLFFP